MKYKNVLPTCKTVFKEMDIKIKFVTSWGNHSLVVTEKGEAYIWGGGFIHQYYNDWNNRGFGQRWSPGGGITKVGPAVNISTSYSLSTKILKVF